jgi:hypothetical protein
MNRGRNTAILAILAAALGAYLFFVERNREAPAAEAPDSPRGRCSRSSTRPRRGSCRRSGDTTTIRKVISLAGDRADDVPVDQTGATSAA